jgi:hypothetical protein
MPQLIRRGLQVRPKPPVASEKKCLIMMSPSGVPVTPQSALMHGLVSCHVILGKQTEALEHALERHESRIKTAFQISIPVANAFRSKMRAWRRLSLPLEHGICPFSLQN